MFASTNALTSQDIIRAVNFARKYPHTIRDRLFAKYGKMPGPAHDPTCYTDAISFTNSQVPLKPLYENAGLDLAAWKQSRYIVQKLGKIDHIGEGGSTTKDRILAMGTWMSCWEYGENIGQILRPDAIDPSADEFVEMWILDCGVTGKGHRTTLYNTKFMFQGCGVFKGPMTENGKTLTGTLVTCDFTTPYRMFSSVYPLLAEAGLTVETNAKGFTGV